MRTIALTIAFFFDEGGQFMRADVFVLAIRFKALVRRKGLAAACQP